MTYRIFPALLLSLVLFGGCAAQNHPSAAPESGGAALAAAPESFPAPPAAPQGMLLGAGYISALNEPCYELVPRNTPFESARTICLRGGQWTEVPPMLMDVPSHASSR